MKMKRMTRLMLLAVAGWLPLSGFAADDARCTTVTQSDPGWTDIAATNALSGTILNALGYQQKVQNLSVALAFEGLKTGQVDVFLGTGCPRRNRLSVSSPPMARLRCSARIFPPPALRLPYRITSPPLA